ncbi:MAG: hypothetical protein NVV63_02335 [Opitutus sp.]|nr:hypothetical protein [Opitutus sp.]
MNKNPESVERLTQRIVDLEKKRKAILAQVARSEAQLSEKLKRAIGDYMLSHISEAEVQVVLRNLLPELSPKLAAKLVGVLS